MIEEISLLNNSHKLWEVNVGTEALSLLDRIGIKGVDRDNIVNEAVDILESCGDPSNETNSITGIAIGYVQSGKTLSFTTVSALASQNGFNLIIVIAGSTTKLVNQTTERLSGDLDIHNRSETSWKPYKNPTLKNVEEVVCDMEEGLFNDKPVLLVTVMKNTVHLKNLLSLLRSTKIKELGLKAIIIDDEADQASLNTKANSKLENDASTIYSLMGDMCSTLKNHTFLQYTATPQAPLFISILDILSPSFVKILTPGSAYTGGKAFFQRNKESHYPHVIEIPEDEIFAKKNPITEIPKSLVESMMYYFLTVAVGVIRGEHPKTHNRTMMIHPSQLTMVHSVYKRWADQLKKRWMEELSLREDDIDRKILINEFARIYSLLRETSEDIPTFDEVASKVKAVIKITPILLSNSSLKQEIDWKKHYSMILVGGQILDRGFTVEGLNITYMPRSIGVGNADTIQQRCRFFGYKKGYLDMCRIFLPRRSKRAYIDYVLHEEDLRNKLKRFSASNKSLSEFKRAFLLSPELNITRKNVISDDLRRYRMTGWRPIVQLDDNYEFNTSVIDEFISRLEFTPSPQSGDLENQKHVQCNIDSDEVLESLLVNLSYVDVTNSLYVNHILSLISVLNDMEPQVLTIVKMSNNTQRTRSLNEQGKIPNLLQGSNVKTNYYGDRSVCSKDNITIQVHDIKVINKPIEFRTLAFHIPEGLSQNIIALSN
jgi:hypothetical protein